MLSYVAATPTPPPSPPSTPLHAPARPSQFNDSKVPGDLFAAVMTAASRVPGEVTAEFLLKAVSARTQRKRPSITPSHVAQRLPWATYAATFNIALCAPS